MFRTVQSSVHVSPINRRAPTLAPEAEGGLLGAEDMASRSGLFALSTTSGQDVGTCIGSAPFALCGCELSLYRMGPDRADPRGERAPRRMALRTPIIGTRDHIGGVGYQSLLTEDAS
jgi:hypothetical protein